MEFGLVGFESKKRKIFGFFGFFGIFKIIISAGIKFLSARVLNFYQRGY
jgi:hypothetical protein